MDGPLLLSSARARLYASLFETSPITRTFRVIDRLLSLLILVSVLLTILEHVPVLRDEYGHYFGFFDALIVILFALEYLLRLLSGGLSPEFEGRSFKTLRYLVTPMALIDAAVIVPYALSGLVFIDVRTLRLLRLFKFARVILPKWHRFKALNQGRSIQAQVYSALHEDAYSGELQSFIDNSLVVIISLNILAVVLESVPSIHAVLWEDFWVFDLLSVIVFTIEYVLRLYSAPATSGYQEARYPHLRYATSVTAIIDLIAILPFYLTFFIHADLRFLRVLRLLRILKLTRYSHAVTAITEVITEEMPSLIAASFVLFLVTILSASIMYLVEHDAQPEKFGSIPLALYWSVITLTTVGYGDVVPITMLGKVMAMIIAIMGLGFISLPTGILAMGFMEKLRQKSTRFKLLVQEKALDGSISPSELEELDAKAKALGLTRAQKLALEQEELQEMKVSKAESQQDSNESQDIDTLAQQIHRLSDADRRQLITLLIAKTEDPQRD